VARSGDEVAEHLRQLTQEKAKAVGQAALRRILSEHTYAHRAEQVEAVLDAHCTHLMGAERAVGVEVLS
jgi:spore maturation protein CgeB